MVPQQSDGSRFSNPFPASIGSAATEGQENGRRCGPDTGWKSRCVPLEEKEGRAEPEPEEVAAEATFRDFRKGKGKK